MTLGQKIKQLREQQGFSREELAKKLDLSYWAISKYETDNRVPDTETIKKLALLFGVSIDFLYGHEDNHLKSSLPFQTDSFLNDLLKKVPDLTDEEKESLEEHMQFALKIIEKERQRRAAAQKKDGD